MLGPCPGWDPVRVGPCPGWGPVRVGAHMGQYGPKRYDFVKKIIDCNEKS